MKTFNPCLRKPKSLFLAVGGNVQQKAIWKKNWKDMDCGVGFVVIETVWPRAGNHLHVQSQNVERSPLADWVSTISQCW